MKYHPENHDEYGRTIERERRAQRRYRATRIKISRGARRAIERARFAGA